jgi:L-fuconolactonase
MLDFPIVDSHTHLLDQRRFSYSWASGAPALKRDWNPDDLAAAAKPYAIEGFVFVEVDVDMPQYLDEADWVDELANRDRRVLGAVACLPLERGAAIEPEIARIAGLTVVRGVRRLIQNQPDPDFVLKPDFLSALRLLPKYNLAFDICIFHHQLPNTIAMVRACPEVSFVLDHIAKPGIKAGLTDPWRRLLRELAAMPNVVCKLSGLQRGGSRVMDARTIASLYRPYDRMLRRRPHPVRRRLAGVRTGRRLCQMAGGAGLGNIRLLPA